MRILLLADTHGQVHAEIAELATQVDAVVHAGDIGHPDVLHTLTRDDAPLYAVRGNNDIPAKWPPAGHTALARLAPRKQIDLPGGDLVVVHGDRHNPVAQRHALLRDAFPTARLVVYGHSHRQVIDKATRPWIVNPGAAGRNRTYGGAGCVVLNATHQRWVLRAYRFPLQKRKT